MSRIEELIKENLEGNKDVKLDDRQRMVKAIQDRMKEAAESEPVEITVEKVVKSWGY